MSTINFPDSPQINDEFTAEDRTWIWDGTVWNSKETEIVTVIENLPDIDNNYILTLMSVI
jgi:hypothetical protein